MFLIIHKNMGLCLFFSPTVYLECLYVLKITLNFCCVLVVVKNDYVLGGHWGSSVCLDYLEVWTDKQVHISNQYFFRRKVRFFL